MLLHTDSSKVSRKFARFRDIGGNENMKAQSTGPILSAVFVDYDNIYLSLKRKNEEAAKRFAKDANLWLRELTSGALITTHNEDGAHNRASRGYEPLLWQPHSPPQRA